MYETTSTYLDYELAYRAERMRGERPDQHHEGHRVTRPHPVAPDRHVT